MARDDLGKLRGLAGEKGYRLDKLPQRGCWQLVDEATGEIAERPDGATAFNVSPGAIILSITSPNGGTRMQPITPDEKQLIPARVARDLDRLGIDAKQRRRQLSGLPHRHGRRRSPSAPGMTGAGNVSRITSRHRQQRAVQLTTDGSEHWGRAASGTEDRRDRCTLALPGRPLCKRT